MPLIIEDIVASGHGPLSPIFFAVHSTANPGASARNHATYWKNNPDYAVHLVSDWNEALHTVPYNALCWQVGNGNSTCEGLEICEATNSADFRKGIDIAVSVVQERIKAHGWNVSSVKSHLWFSENYGGSDHTDPIPYFTKWGYTWEQFLQEVGSQKTATDEETEENMQCIYQPNGESYLVYYDGSAIHPLSHPDEVEAINMVYRACNGKDIPRFRLGTKEAPWANRFSAAVNRTQ